MLNNEYLSYLKKNMSSSLFIRHLKRCAGSDFKDAHSSLKHFTYFYKSKGISV